MKKIFTPFILWYIRVAAKIQLQKNNPKIIGIGGSSGKSSLASLVAGILQSHYRVNTTKEKNSETGIPLHILNIHIEPFSYLSWLKAIARVPLQLLFYFPNFDVLIAEMGIDSPVEPKNMSYLLKIIQPSIGVVTNITPEHSVFFDPYVEEKDETIRTKKILELTAQQELLLLHSLPLGGCAVINRDDRSIARAEREIVARKISISTKDITATIFAKHIFLTTIHPSMTIVYKNNDYVLRTSQQLPIHFAYEFLCAIGLSLGIGLSIQEAIDGLTQHLLLPPGRMTILKGIKNTTIIDSSYNNATLPPILDMLDFLKDIAQSKRKVAIIGDMRELGSQSKENHEVVAQKLLMSANLIILIGPLLRNYAAPILKAQKANFYAFDTFSAARATILQELREKDTILVKGSQNTLFLERVVEMLLENKKDVEKLCRRGAFWDMKREQTL